jgi:CO dehydrogenase maturation factor
MKIAFVGKGGSGKSTVSASFITHLLKQKQRVLAVDADINQHLSNLIGAQFQPDLALSKRTTRNEIREYLRGTNTLIKDIASFAKTTPPGRGSNLVHITHADPLIQKYAVDFAPQAYFMHVGTYDEDGIGTSCYHGSLSIFENIVSHTQTNDNEWLVADMVAGTDAFAGALYLLFDIIFMVVEPTPESVGVFNQFSHLAQKAGTYDHVYVIGNKIEDNDDATYLQEAIGNKLIATLPINNSLRKLRQRGESINELDETASKTFAHIEEFARDHAPDANSKLSELHDLHLHFADQDYTRTKHGDISGQIDKQFQFSEVVSHD